MAARGAVPRVRDSRGGGLVVAAARIQALSRAGVARPVHGFREIPCNSFATA